MDTSRRTFVADTVKFVLLTGAAAAAWDYVQAGEPEKAPGYDATAHWWAMVLDIEKCIGCGRCVQACKAENHVPLDSSHFRTWVECYEIDPDDPEHPRVTSPNGGYDGFPPVTAPGVKTFFVPKMCNHCADSPCVQVCPVGATFATRDGVVLVDREYCLGCRYCVQACPYGCRYINPETHTADKCTLCYHRITRGLQPACVEVCPTGTRYLGDLKNPHDPIHEFLRTHRVQVLKPQMATHPKAFYNGLDAAVR